MEAKDRAEFIKSIRQDESTVMGDRVSPQQPAAERNIPDETDMAMRAEPAGERKAAGGEEESALAAGLPDWDIIPPQVVVRRKRKI